MKPKIARVVEALRTECGASRETTLDAIGAAIGDEAFGADEVEVLFDAIARAGLTVRADRVNGTADLKRVLDAARTVAARTGKRASMAEIASETGLTVAAVRGALLLAQVMAR